MENNKYDSEAVHNVHDSMIESIERLDYENSKLKECLSSVIRLQEENYGNGMNTHLALITKVKEIKLLIAELNK